MSDPLQLYLESLVEAAEALRAGCAPLLAEEFLSDNHLSVVRETLPLVERRQFGVFFTPKSLAIRLASRFEGLFTPGCCVLDTSCGAGDLLLACQSLATSSGMWLDLRGIERSEKLASMARLRLELAHALHGLSDASVCVVVGDGVVEPSRSALSNADFIVMNPPYSNIHAPVPWAQGAMSAAAVAFASALERAREGTRIAAILPEVLRSGSRYGKWREYVESMLSELSLESVGVFDPFADVDVFILFGRKAGVVQKALTRFPWVQVGDEGLKLGEIASVAVGSVVPHRDPESGGDRPYLSVDSAPRFGTVAVDSLPVRRYAGRAFTPPFVAIRRTSGPRDTPRVVPTLVVGRVPVSVENHLLVIMPGSPDVESCRRLMEHLSCSEVTTWFNARIRCRHLTVGALRECPVRQAHRFLISTLV